MKAIILYIFITSNLLAEPFLGEGVNKLDAFKDAYLKFTLKYGSIQSSQRLEGNINLLNNVTIKSLRFIPSITLRSCKRLNTQFLCDFDFVKAEFPDSFRLNFEIPKCSGKNGLCHNLIEGPLSELGQVIVIKGYIEIIYYRYGINIAVTRHRERHLIHGVGFDEAAARRSLRSQGELILKKRARAKDVIDLVYRESLYDMYIRAHDEGGLKYFVKKGLYPVEVLSKGRNVIFFVKKMRGASLLD